MNNTPNVIIDRLMEASMDKSAAAYARHFQLEASLLQNLHRFQSTNKKTVHLNSDATFCSDVDELRVYLSSEHVVDRLVASLKIVPLLRNADPLASSATPAFTEAQNALTALLLAYPVLLDPGFCLRTEKNSATYTVLERILISPGLRLPNTDQGTSREDLVTFASHRSVFGHLRESISDKALPKLLGNVSTLGCNLQVYANMVELTEAARVAIKDRRSPPKVTTELHLDTRENCSQMASGLGRLLWSLLFPDGATARFYKGSETFVEHVLRLALHEDQIHGAFVKGQILESLSSCLEGRLSGVQAGKSQGGALVAALQNHGLVATSADAAQYAFAQVVFSSFNGSSPRLSTDAEASTAAEFVVDASKAAGIEPPWEALCERLDVEAGKVISHGLHPIATSAEQALRARAAEVQMLASIGRTASDQMTSSTTLLSAPRLRRAHV